MNHVRSLCVGLAPLLLASAAAADPAVAAATADARVHADAPAPQVAAATSAASAPTLSAAPSEPASDVRYPRAIIDRPLTYPAGVVAAGFDLSSSTSDFASPATLRSLGGFGITDALEVNFGHYQFPTNAAGKGSFDLGLGYKLMRGALDGKLEVIGRAQSGYSLMTDSLNPLLLGAHAQYNVTSRLALLTPGGQLAIGLAGSARPVTLQLPVSVGYQATPVVYVQLDTTLATLGAAHAASTVMFADATPAALTLYVNALPQLDAFIGGSASFLPASTTDAQGAIRQPRFTDTISVLVGARYYLGRL